MFGSGQDKRNLIIAIGAIFVVLVGWQFLMPALFPPDERPQRVAEQPALGTAPPSLDQVVLDADDPAQAGLGQAGIDSPRIQIESPRLSGSIARLGGRIDSITLLDYREEADEESPNIVLLQPRDAVRPYFADFGWISANEGIALPQPDTLWDADKLTLSPGRPVTLRWDNGAGLRFTRKIDIDENFVFTVTQSVLNTTGAPLALTPYSRIARFSDATESILPFKPLFIFQDGALGVFGEDYRDADYDDMRDAYDARVENPRAGTDYRYDATGGWMGLTDKYWLVALIPDQQVPFQASFEYWPVDGGTEDSFQTIYEAEPLTVSPGQAVSLTSHLFTGAKEIRLLDDYEEALGVDRLDLAVDFGPAWFLSKPMFYVIDFFNRATGNFGVAILLLTICVRVLLFPLANKAYASMSRMRKLQPEMIRLRERFKDDKQRM
ncbi:MAG: membrane protein insertase YidC, partial [Rhodospirillales bacterium]|nr:membrane protein insertase YidC [Rhodospirillales bacterium]